MKKYTSVRGLIEALGGQTAVSRELGISQSAVGNMATRGKIAAKHWTAIIAMAKKEKVTGVSFKVIDELVNGSSKDDHKKEECLPA